ncbi:MAG TPA: TetR/AcrR family transcriptional regulator [Mycobacteriales bacterium]
MAIPATGTASGGTAPGTSAPREDAPARGGRMPRSARRKQLMAAAQEVFVAHGYHAAAMDDIADRAGVSKPVLYQHFPGKLELYLALLDKNTGDLVQALRAAMAKTTDNAQRVHNAVSAYFDFVDGESADVQGAFRLVFETDLRNEPAVRERIAAVSRLCMQAVADTIAADTGLPLAQVELLSVAVTGTSEVAARWWLESDRALPKADAVRLVEGLVWRGISHFPLAEEPVR